MNPALKNDLGLFFGADKRLNNHPPRAADHTKDAIAPIRNAGQPQEIGHKRIGRAHQFAVFLPILRVGMMCEMHDLIVISWKDHHKANQPAKEHIYPAGRKNGRMAQLMLGGIEEIEQNTQDKACQPDPCVPKAKLCR